MTFIQEQLNVKQNFKKNKSIEIDRICIKLYLNKKKALTRKKYRTSIV